MAVSESNGRIFARNTEMRKRQGNWPKREFRIVAEFTDWVLCEVLSPAPRLWVPLKLLWNGERGVEGGANYWLAWGVLAQRLAESAEHRRLFVWRPELHDQVVAKLKELYPRPDLV